MLVALRLVSLSNPCPLLSSRHIFRYHACMMRNRFDQNTNVKDMRVAHQMLLDGEAELFQNRHYQPKTCKDIELIDGL